MAFILGITGGIATGKSTVVDVFRKQGVPVVDGDLVAREIVEPGMPALQALVKVFGADILVENRLDRKKLGSIVFSDTKKRQQLDQIMDQYLRQAIREQIQAAAKTAPLVVADIPLMYEADYDQYMDQVAVVYVPTSVQATRLMQRDGLTLEAAQKRMDSQLSIEEKRLRADILFDNQGSKEATKEQVMRWLSAQKF